MLEQDRKIERQAHDKAVHGLSALLQDRLGFRVIIIFSFPWSKHRFIKASWR